MRITLDTNVLISATFWHGDSEKIINKVEQKEITLILSKEILEEYYRVLDYDEIQQKIEKKSLEMKESLLKISSIAEIIEVTSHVKIVQEDMEDNKILECALDGKVEYIITKDHHLLKIGMYEGIKILTPQEFLEIFETKSNKSI